jgi:hypothetical protein
MYGLLAGVIVAVVVGLAGCHGGRLAGEGAPCSVDAPCRRGYSCVSGACRPAVAEGGGGGGGTGARCDPGYPFGPPVRVEGINSAPQLAVGDTDARFVPDQRTVYFVSSRSGDALIYSSTRLTAGGVFEPPKLVTNVNISNYCVLPSAADDDLTLYFECAVPASYIFVARRRSTTEAFSDPQVVNLGSSDSGDGAPYLLSQSGVIYFQSPRRDENADLYRAEQRTVGAVEVTPLDGVNTGATESLPVVTPDELTLFFYTDLLNPVRGGGDIFTAFRDSKDEEFRDARLVAELDSSFGQSATWISPDGCRLYFNRAELGATGERVGTRVYYADRRDPAFIPDGGR